MNSGPQEYRRITKPLVLVMLITVGSPDVMKDFLNSRREDANLITVLPTRQTRRMIAEANPALGCCTHNLPS